MEYINQGFLKKVLSLKSFFSLKKDFKNKKVACFSMNENAAKSEIIKFKNLFKNSEIYGFSLYGAGINRSNNNCRSIVLDFPFDSLNNKFDAVIFGSSLLIYKTNWHRELFFIASKGLKRNGEIILPTWHLKNKSEKSSIDLKCLESWLNAKGNNYLSGNISFKSPNVRNNKNMLKWYKNCGRSLIDKEIFDSKNNLESKVSDIGISYRPSKIGDLTFKIAKNKNYEFSKSYESKIFKSIEYLSLGTGQKAAAIKVVIDRYIKTKNKISIIDHGSGSGLVPLQILCENSINVERVEIVEPTNLYLTMLYSQISWLNYKNKKSIRLSNYATDNYQYLEKFDLITFFQMFFLVSKEKREKCFEDAFLALKPGGKIIWWEIPKTYKSEKLAYYEKMMSHNDIVNLLKPYKNKLTLETKFLNEVHHEDFRDKPLIWIISK